MNPRIARAGCAAVVLGAALLAAGIQPAMAQNHTVYTNDFSHGAGGGSSPGKVAATWSSTATDVAPSGRRAGPPRPVISCYLSVSEAL